MHYIKLNYKCNREIYDHKVVAINRKHFVILTIYIIAFLTQKYAICVDY